MIRVEGLTKRYGRVTVLEDIDLSVSPGETVALWGPNGAGKTTIIRAILGLISYEGDITVAGHDVRRDGKAVRRLVANVPQDPSFYPDLTVRETLEFSARLRGVEPARIDPALEAVGLSAEASKRVGALSGGMAQRLALAVVLLADPPVLLVDEPTSHLDLAARATVIDALERLRGHDRTIVLTTHRLDELGALAGRILEMSDGRIVGECSPSDLAEKLGVKPRLHVRVGDGELDGALAALRAAGLAAEPNHSGVLVEASGRDKMTALKLLEHAGMTVRDIEVWMR